jgi:3-keto-5-aminohexanoate cleavage enzyme
LTPLIVTAAVTGGGAAKSPVHPVTPEAVVSAAIDAWRAGAAVVHLHARTSDGGTTMAPSAYRAAIDAIRSGGCNALIDLSAGDDGGKADHPARLAVAGAGGDLVTLAAGPFNLGKRLYDNSPGFVDRMAQAITAAGARPVIEVFDTGQIATIHRMLMEGRIDRPLLVEFVMGVPGAMPADARLLPVLLDHLPQGCLWAASIQTTDPKALRQIMEQVIVLGGHVRTGLEDHPFDISGNVAVSNAAMVREAIALSLALGRPVATTRQARGLLSFGS